MSLAIVSQCTKFEVFSFTRYEAMNGGEKCRKWGGLWRLGGIQGHGQCHHSIERIRLPIRLSCAVFAIKASYLSRVADFDPPHLHLAPSLGVIPVEFRGDLWRQKTRVPALLYVLFVLFSVLVELRIVTDTDRQTDGHRAMASTADA